MTLPIFSSENSLGQSILTVEKPEKETLDKSTRPVSIFQIAKEHNIPCPVIIDTDFSGFWKMYKYAQSARQQFTFGIKLYTCELEDSAAEDAANTESRVAIVMKNSDAYKDLVKIYTHASTVGMKDGRRRISWKNLSDMWTGNLELLLPFYSSFLARNMMHYGSRCVPHFGNIKPVFLRESHSLPFDPLLQNAIDAYTKGGSTYPVLDSHQIYYYKNSDIQKFVAYKCITGRSSWGKADIECPNLDHFGSDEFSFESWKNKTV